MKRLPGPDGTVVVVVGAGPPAATAELATPSKPAAATATTAPDRTARSRWLRRRNIVNPVREPSLPCYVGELTVVVAVRRHDRSDTRTGQGLTIPDGINSAWVTGVVVARQCSPRRRTCVSWPGTVS
jgi:hypothetical protein